MATRGRKPKPTAMKELEGNPGKHPLNTSEPKPNKKAPACPKWLEPEAKKEWRKKLMGSDPRKTLAYEEKERCHQDTLPRILYICDSDKSYSFTKSDTGLPAL